MKFIQSYFLKMDICIGSFIVYNILRMNKFAVERVAICIYYVCQTSLHLRQTSTKQMLISSFVLRILCVKNVLHLRQTSMKHANLIICSQKWWFFAILAV